jgi:hypothetical protein
MYGTIFNLNVKPGHEKDLLEIMDGNTPKGGVAWFLMKPDDDNGNLIGVAVFESKEAHIANANSPKQNETFVKLMEHLDSEPTWTDGEYIQGLML